MGSKYGKSRKELIVGLSNYQILVLENKILHICLISDGVANFSKVMFITCLFLFQVELILWNLTHFLQNPRLCRTVSYEHHSSTLSIQDILFRSMGQNQTIKFQVCITHPYLLDFNNLTTFHYLQLIAQIYPIGRYIVIYKCSIARRKGNQKLAII